MSGLYESAIRKFWSTGLLELRFPFPDYNAAWTIELRLKGVLAAMQTSANVPEDRHLATCTRTRITVSGRKQFASSGRKGPVDLLLYREGASSEEIFADRLRNMGVTE